MSRNHNRPAKGSRITVDPIRDQKDIETIKRLLKDKPRGLLLFTMGINNGLRVGDLQKLKVGQVRHMKPGQSISVREGKTGKVNVLMMNRSTLQGACSSIWMNSPRRRGFLVQVRQGEEPAAHHVIGQQSGQVLVQGGQPAG